ncbi:MAG: XdhC family protein [Gemmatimonadota bacterium]
MTSESRITRGLRPGDEALHLASRLEEGGDAWLVQVVDDPSGRLTGQRIVRWREPGTATGGVGSLGSGALDRAVEDLLERQPKRGLHPLVESLQVYVEYFPATPRLLIVGAGHIARPLAQVGHLLGYRVEVLDDRPAFLIASNFPHAQRLVTVDFADPFRDISLGASAHLILVTRGHKYDYECLRRALVDPHPPAYIGMIGSRRRVRATYVQLEREGIPPEAIAAIRAPIGLDLGAETPEEIAVSIAAELVLLARGGTGVPLRDQERVAERFGGTP